MRVNWSVHTCGKAPHAHTCSDGLEYDEAFCEVISVSLHMSVITQDGDSALMIAVREGRTEVFKLLVKVGANVHLQNKVTCQCIIIQGGVVVAFEKL